MGERDRTLSGDTSGGLSLWSVQSPSPPQRFMMDCSILGIKQIFTTWSNPKGNSDTERAMHTIKEDIIWPYDWDNPFEFQVRLAKWIWDYNNDYPNQSLENLTPAQFYVKSDNKEPILT